MRGVRVLGIQYAERCIVIRHLRKGTDVIGNRTAVEKANRHNYKIVVTFISPTRRRLRRLRVRIATNRHHGDWWYPSFALLVILLLTLSASTRFLSQDRFRVVRK